MKIVVPALYRIMRLPDIGLRVMPLRLMPTACGNPHTNRRCKMTECSRRRALAFMGAGAAALPFAATAAAQTKEAQWDQTCEVLVVGSGYAGLCAAIEARNAGADVLLVEKMMFLGGNSALCGGGIAAPGSDLQKAAGVKDSAEQLYQDMLKSGGGLTHKELARVIADNALPTYEWVRDYIGVKFDRLGYHGGHSVPRSAAYMKGNGAKLVKPLVEKAKALGVKIEQGTRLAEILLEDGRVSGAVLQTGYRFPKESSGKLVRCRITKGLVLAGGGFSQNVALRSLHDPRLGPQLESTNHPGATGDALLAAKKIGAMDIQMDWIQLGPWTSPDEKGFGVAPKIVEAVVGFGFMVDPETGRRFVNETGNRKVRSDAIVATGHPAVLVVSTGNVGHVPPEALAKGIENGVVKTFESPEALADFHKIPKDAFMKTLADWNACIAAKQDPEFKAKIFDDAKPNEGKLYSIRLWPRVHYTMGGLAITPKAEVIGLDMKPIKGLYAAGEICGGVHGMVRLGTVSIADCLIFGRIAGREAASVR